MKTIYTRVQENCELRNLTENTQRSYLRIIRQFAEYFNRSPEELGTVELREYLLHLKRDKKQATKTMGVAYSALKFFYHKVLERPWEISPVPTELKVSGVSPCSLFLNNIFFHLFSLFL